MAFFSSTTTPRPLSNRTLWIIRLLCLISLVLIAIWTRTGLEKELSPAAIRTLYQASLLPALPFLISLVLLFTPRKDLGLAVVAGFGTAMLVGLVPFTGLMVLLSGFITQRSDFVGLLMMVLMVPVQIALVALSGRALYRLPPEMRHPLAWPSGLATGVIYAGLAVSPFYGLQSRYQQHGHDVSQNDRSAEQAIAEITRCAQAYRTRHPEEGFPASLAAMGPGQDSCLSVGIASGEDQGYRFTYAPGLPNTKGHVQIYSVAAQPIGYLETGSRVIAGDEQGQTAGAFASISGPEVTGPEAWWNHGTGLLPGVKHCVLLAASRQPTQGYPAGLADLGPSGIGCLKPGLIIQDVGGDEVRTHYETLTYLGGPPDTQGRITRFEIYSRSNRDSLSFFMDESGVVRVHRDSGWASVHDPIWQPRPSEQPTLPPSPPSDADLEQGCVDGLAADCLVRGTRLMDQTRHEEVQNPEFGRSGFARPEAIVQGYRRAEVWLAKGCAGGLMPACHTLAQSYDDRHGVDHDPLAAAPLFRKACEAGEALSCYSLGQIYESGRAPQKQKTFMLAMTPSGDNAQKITTWEDDWSDPSKAIMRDPVQAVAYYARGCDLNSDNACESAGSLLLRGEKLPKNTVKAAEMFQRQCDLSRAMGCVQLGALYAEGDGIPRDASRSAYLARKACVLGGGSLCGQPKKMG
jgi:TPR repeat protein